MTEYRREAGRFAVHHLREGRNKFKPQRYECHTSGLGVLSLQGRGSNYGVREQRKLLILDQTETVLIYLYWIYYSQSTAVFFFFN